MYSSYGRTDMDRADARLSTEGFLADMMEGVTGLSLGETSRFPAQDGGVRSSDVYREVGAYGKANEPGGVSSIQKLHFSFTKVLGPVMADVATRTPTSDEGTTPEPVRQRRFTREEYFRMAETGDWDRRTAPNSLMATSSR